MDYLKDNTEVNNLLDSKYIKKINDIVNKYRNPSAHPEFMSLEKANECRKIMPDYSEVVIETNNLIMKKAVFADWKQLYRNITSRPEAAQYMLWKIDASEEEAKERMIRTLDFQRKEKYALTVYLKTNEVPKAIGWASMREVSSGIYEDMGIAIGPDFVGKGYGKQILNALCDEARNQGAKEFHCSYREKNLASRGLQDACGFKFDYRSEEKTDPRTGEIYVVVNTKKDLQYVV